MHFNSTKFNSEFRNAIMYLLKQSEMEHHFVYYWVDLKI